MQRVKLLGLTVMTALALSALAAGTAFGAVGILSKTGQTVLGFKFSGTSKKETLFTILKGFGVTKCAEVETEGEQEGTGLLGSFHLHWKGCTTNLGGTCTGLSDAAGTLLGLGTWHLVFDKLSSEGSLGVAILLLIEQFHFTCEGGFVPKTLVLVSGQSLCLIPINVLSTKLAITCEKGREKGDPGETVYWNESGTKVEMGEGGLLASENEGAQTMAALEGSIETTTSEEIEIMG